MKREHKRLQSENGFFEGDCVECGLPKRCDPRDPRRSNCRAPWDETWMTVARAISERSYDPRLKVGAIIVTHDNTQVLSVGYNGNYSGGPHRHESPEPGKSGFIHAEVNALVKCDFNHHKQKHMYITHSPCRDCAKLIVNARIKRLVYETEYRDTSGIELLREAGVEVEKYQRIDT